MCEAIQQMIDEAVQVAKEETQKAKKERFSTLFSNVKSLMGKMGWSLEQAMDVLSVSESDQKEIRKMIEAKT